MTAPGDLMQALFLRLKTDASLSALLGGVGLLEQANDKAAFPNVTYGRTSAFDLETGADNDSDQLVTLHVSGRKLKARPRHASSWTASGRASMARRFPSVRAARRACRWNSPRRVMTRTLRSTMGCCASAL